MPSFPAASSASPTRLRSGVRKLSVGPISSIEEERQRQCVADGADQADVFLAAERESA
jgi:hypothetical protein